MEYIIDKVKTKTLISCLVTYGVDSFPKKKCFGAHLFECVQY